MSSMSDNPRVIYFIATVSGVSGLLFGYDNGIIGSAMLYISRRFELSPFQQAMVTSMILVGAIVGALAGGALSSRFGRRRIVVMVALVFAVGAVAAALAPNAEALALSRFVLGLSVGGASSTVPVYVAELAPPRIRGTLTVLFELMVGVGVLSAYLVGFVLAGEGWRWMFGIATVPAVFLLVGMFFLPESPRWLVGKGRPGEARDVLRRVRPRSADVDREVAEIEEVDRRRSAGGWRLVCGSWARPAMVVALGIAMFSQVTGVNAIVYYAPTILTAAGFDDSGALLAGVGVGLAVLVGSIVGTALVDRVGRRRLLLTMMPASAACMTILACTFFAHDISGAAAWVVVVSMLAFVVFNAGSIQIALWLVGPEVFPLRIRGTATSASTGAAWGFNLLVSLTALSAIDTLGRPATFLTYAAMNVACCVFVYLWVPETAGRTLEEVESALNKGRRFRDNLAEVARMRTIGEPHQP
ncbi:sugar porter family MFS transporter [Pseudonocardia acaciae]|uniref:sugar porter family MFS transporter n=1 Tax=Pseudonocardia acaciae TaxID=551276 RepID=UPI000687911A|nr:sugar porter family MFS transporter [Pseudonocardia acaciae]